MLRSVRTFHFNGSVFEIFQCENIGDELPPHSHTFNHLTLALNGTIEIFDETGSLAKGDPSSPPFEYKAGRTHGIRAVTTGAAFMNISPSYTPTP